ncbi:MAG: hypothetical protein DRO06_03200 [Thermoproteota archaeon]|nr:MAG: hypothetical protein DRO06_03200 [Candidatus Korarchaeota archaeon]
MDELISLAALGVAAIAAPLAARVTGVPCVVIEMVVGLVLGPSLLGLVDPSGPWVTFLYEFGLIYLLFMAGLEVRAEFLRERALDSLAIGSASTLAPFAMGYALGLVLGVEPALLGVTLSTTSVGVVLPAVREIEEVINSSGGSGLTRLLIGATAVSDMLSMLMLAFALPTEVPPWMTALAVAAMSLSVPWASSLRGYSRLVESMSALEERYSFTSRLSLVLMILLAAGAHLAGAHAVVGSFFAGVLISELVSDIRHLEDRLVSFGYSLFLPAFFLVAGARIDLPTMLSAGRLHTIPAMLVASYAGKILGVYASARIRGVEGERALVMGNLMWAKLSLVVAAAEAGLDLGLIGVDWYSTMVLFALFTVLLAPLAARALAERYARLVISVEEAEQAI